MMHFGESSMNGQVAVMVDKEEEEEEENRRRLLPTTLE